MFPQAQTRECRFAGDDKILVVYIKYAWKIQRRQMMLSYSAKANLLNSIIKSVGRLYPPFAAETKGLPLARGGVWGVGYEMPRSRHKQAGRLHLLGSSSGC